MPAWIHDRARHLQRKNPEMPEGQAFAIATQQAHKLGKTPKGYGTPEGRAAARAKYTRPRSHYRRTPDRPKTAGAQYGALFDELIAIDKEAGLLTPRFAGQAPTKTQLALQRVARKFGWKPKEFQRTPSVLRSSKEEIQRDIHNLAVHAKKHGFGVHPDALKTPTLQRELREPKRRSALIEAFQDPKYHRRVGATHAALL